MTAAAASTPPSAERDRRPVVLVTGGSRGIGLALAHGFAARGHDIVLVARDSEGLQQAAAAVAAAHGVFVEHASCDLAEPGAVTALLAALDVAGFRVEILVNCAGVGAPGAFADSRTEDVRAALRLNTEAATVLMRACLPDMVARGRGGVLNVASLAGMMPMPYLALYSATKAYLTSLSRAAAQEVAGTGVTISVLLPGPVDTAFFARGLQADNVRTGLLPGLSPQAVARVAIHGFLARQAVITPGMLGWLSQFGLKLLPQHLLVALVRFVLWRSLSPETGAATQAAAQIARSTQSTPPVRPRRAATVPGLVLACIAAILAVQIGLATRKAPTVDAGPRSNIAAGAGLLEHGVYADAFVPAGAQRPTPGRYLAPGYPAFVAGFAVLDRGLAGTIRCLAAAQADCVHGNPWRALIVLQALLALLALALLSRVALALSGSSEIAGLATALTFVMGRYGELAATPFAYAIVPPLALIFCSLLFFAHRRGSLSLAVGAGLLLGYLALVEVYYAAILALAPILLVWAEARRPKPRWSFGIGAAAAFIVAAFIVLGPWMARNHQQFGDIALTRGSETKQLAERMVYIGSTAGELLVASFFWLPGVGDLSSLMLSAETTRKFDVYYKGSLLLESGRILEATTVPASESQFHLLLEVFALGRPADYAITTVLLIERGLRSTGGFLVLWGWIALPLLLRRLAAQRQLAAFLLICGPLWGVTLVQSLLTANLPWMNAPLVFVYAYAIASVTGGLELPFGLRRLLPAPDAGSAAPAATSVRALPAPHPLQPPNSP